MAAAPVAQAAAVPPAAAAAARGRLPLRRRGRIASRVVEDGHRADGRHVLRGAVARVAATFVAVGRRRSRRAQTLCILEAMKLMNEIVAEEAGVIREVAVENGDPVEYGTVLFYYEAS